MPPANRKDLYLSIGVTSHRDLVASEVPGLADRIRAFFAGLQEEFPGLPLQLLTPLAAGGDQLAADVALSMGIPVVAVLPMAQDEYERDFDDAERGGFRALLSRAARVIELPPVAIGDPSMDDEHRRALQYAQVGVFTSDHCQILLAIWDGKASDRLGGTGQVVHYHLTAVMDGFEGDPTPAGLLTENENDLVHHVVCSRDRPGGAPAEANQPLDATWFSSRDGGTRSAAIPPDYMTLLRRLERFVLDWRDKQAIIRRNSGSLLRDAPALPVPDGVELTDRLFQAADGLAIHFQARVNGSLRALHLLAILMGMVFLVYTEYDAPAVMILVFLALFFAGVALHLVGNAREWHRKYLDYRTLAEGLRVQFYWNLSGVVDQRWAGFAYDNFLQTQDVDLGWIRHVMRHASMYRQRGQSPDEGWLPWVLQEWIGRRDGGSGQLAYYTHKEIVNTARFRRTSTLGNLCLWAGIGIAVILFFADSTAGQEVKRSLLVLMGALPLVAGVWDAYSHKRAEKELIKQYGFMGRVFLKARQLLDGSADPVFQRRVLKALGQAALEEEAEWLLMHRERPMEHGRL